MVNLQSQQLDLIFYALSDPTRRQILRMIKEGTRSITDLAHPFEMSLAAISKHIKILEKAKLLSREKVGRVHEITFNPGTLLRVEECVQFYTEFWSRGLDSLADELEGKTKSSKRRK